MSLDPVPRTWTLASWLVTGADPDAVGDALADVEADAFALQRLRKSDIERVADRLSIRHAWELSYHPMSRLLPGSGVGLAILTPHSIGDSVSVVTNNHSSTWSRRRRIAHFATVERADHSGYTIGHALSSPDPELIGGSPPSPLVWFQPAQIAVDPSRAIVLPDGATNVTTDLQTPIAGSEQLLTVTFEYDWDQDDTSVA